MIVQQRNGDRVAFFDRTNKCFRLLIGIDLLRAYQVPFSMHDREALRALLREGKFEAERIEDVTLEGTSPTALDLATGLVEGNPVGTAIRERGSVPPDTVIAAVAETVAREYGDRPVRLPLRAIVASARAGART